MASLTFRDLFKKYLLTDSKENIDILNEEIRTKCLNGSFYIGEDFDLVFLYRQARIFNIQRDLPFNVSSKFYEEKRKKIVSFFNQIKFHTKNGMVHVFSFNEHNNLIDYTGFLKYCAVQGSIDDRFTYLIINEMKMLFDAEALAAYALYYVDIAIIENENKMIPQIIFIILETNVDCSKEDIKKRLNYIDCHLIKDDEKHVRDDYFNFKNINYEYFCLTNKSKGFLLLSNECISTFIPSTFFDYSIISLQYYKIIETEIKNKILTIATKSIYGNRFYIDESLYIPKDEHNFTFLTLEGINLIFQKVLIAIEKEKIPSFYREIYNKCGRNKEFLRFFKDITSKPFRDKYRNPPAHTEPLSAENLREITDIYMNFIDNMRKIEVNETKDVTRFPIIDQILN